MKKLLKSLDLGCGDNPRNPFHAQVLCGVDIMPTAGEALKDLNSYHSVDLGIQPLPFPHDHFDYITAYDLLEHIPRIAYIESKRANPFIFLMNEITRILKPKGIFYSLTPIFPAPEAFQDPTHVNIMTNKTMRLYFAGASPYARRYGFNGNLDILHEDIFADSHLSIFMQKVSLDSSASLADLEKKNDKLSNE